MPPMPEEVRAQFEQHHAAGMAAKDRGSYVRALQHFENADLLAREHEDEHKRLDALNPIARAYWSLEYYDLAESTLNNAADIAQRLELVDEQAITISNIGRLLAVKTVKTIPVKDQPEELLNQAVYRFGQAYEMLRDHPHLYFRYANASHGSVVSALAGARSLARELISEGLSVAHKVSPEPYDQRTPAEISPGGLKQLKAARFLIPLGNSTPILAAKARQELVR
jgi:tetratricopeptide (TPR) repeat protein